MKHIAIFNNSGDVQTALNEETLLNPYVAKVSGALDYNTLSPVSPGPTLLGEWSSASTSDEGNVYTFKMLDPDPNLWNEDVYIAKGPNCIISSTTIGIMDCYFYVVLRNTSDWRLEFEDFYGIYPTASATFTDSQSGEDLFPIAQGDPVVLYKDDEEFGPAISIFWNGIDELTFKSSSPEEVNLYMQIANPDMECKGEPNCICERQGCIFDGIWGCDCSGGEEGDEGGEESGE